MTKTSFNSVTSQTTFSSLNVGALTGTTSVTIVGDTNVIPSGYCTSTVGVFEESVNRTGCYFDSGTTYTLPTGQNFPIPANVSPVSGVYDAGSNKAKVPTLGVYHVWWHNTGDTGLVFNKLQASFTYGFTFDYLFQYVGASAGAVRLDNKAFHWNFNLNSPFPINTLFMTPFALTSDFAVTNSSATMRIVRIKAHA